MSSFRNKINNDVLYSKRSDCMAEDRGWTCVSLAILASVIAVLMVVVAFMVAMVYGSKRAPVLRVALSLGGVEELESFRAVRGGGPAVVLFHTPGCRYCVKMLPQFEAAARACAAAEPGDGAPRFAHLNAQRHGVLVEELGLPGFPTVVMFGADGGEVAEVRPGYATSAELCAWIDTITRQTQS